MKSVDVQCDNLLKAQRKNEKDGSRVNEFLETLENNFNDSNEAKLQKILLEKKNQPQ